jgi:hypothetical protein
VDCCTVQTCGSPRLAPVIVARHNARHAPSPPPRRRLTFKRLLLALVLGLGAWWGVGWWLSPRPVFALRHTDQVAVYLPGTQIRVAGFHVELDQENRLFVWRRNYPAAGKTTVEQYNLLAGPNPTKEVLAEADGTRCGSKTTHPRGCTCSRTGSQRGGWDH